MKAPYTGSVSRRAFLKGGGALFIGFSIGGLPENAKALGPLPVPSPTDNWLVVNPDDTIAVFLGRVDFGQGSLTALLQIVAEELDVDLDRLKAAQVDTNHSPNQGATVASSSIERGGAQLRAAAADMREELLKRAADRLKVPADTLTVNKGRIQGAQASQSVTYGALVGDRPFEVKYTGKAPKKQAAQYKLVGAPIQRIDLPGKMRGTYTYMQHVRLPNMLHGRVVRPRGQGAYGTLPKVLSVDRDSVKGIPDVRVVHIGDFVGVVASREWDAVRAASQLKVNWRVNETLPASPDLHRKMEAGKTTDKVLDSAGDVERAVASATHVISNTYRGPYQSHGPMAPNCALADVTGGEATITCSTQDIFDTRKAVALAIGFPAERVRVKYVEGSGTFGHSCYDDAAQAAALLSKAVGRPVRVQFMRWDEHGWDNYGPAHLGKIRAAANADGILVAYEYHAWQHGWMFTETSGHMATGGPVRELAGFPAVQLNKFNAGGMYDIANRSLVNHAVGGLDGYPKGSFLRSPMDVAFSFASEQTIDELAQATGIDPVEFRRRNIKDKRWLGVLDAVAVAAQWVPGFSPPASNQSNVIKGRGVGMGTHFASYGAAIADIEVNRKTGKIVVKQLYGALDCGLAVNPANVENQIIGQMTQAVSRILIEEVRLTPTGVASLDWGSYPVLRFSDHPEVTPIVVQRVNEPSTGAGEEVLAATAAAIANAFFNATGKRLREYPMTPERVQAAIG